MSIYSSLYSGVSGLTALGHAMSVIGDNIANSNTTGFKGSRSTFQDILSMTVTTGNGTAQVGQGTVLADVSSTFAQSGFETTDSVTDLAIDGEGFFVLKAENSEQKFFSRAGAFRIDSQNYLANPAGLIAQGTKLDPDTSERVGTATDIKLDTLIAAPSKSDKITLITNLDSTAQAKSTSIALKDRWDATDPDVDGKYISETDYSHSSTIKVYDQQGNSHDVTIYFDKAYEAGTYNTWNFIVTANPSEITSGDKEKTTALLDSGTIVFSSSGKIQSIALETGADMTGKEYPEFTVDFFADAALGDTTMSVKLDFGAKYKGETVGWVSDTLASTQYASTSVNMFQSANGYSRGELQDLKVDDVGILKGVYSNGKTIPLYQISLAKFNNNRGLDKIGGSLYRESTTSGPAAENPPGTNGLGKITSSALEQSNVDIAVEFVKMITTERGFQANSKTIMTADSMIQTVVNLKR